MSTPVVALPSPWRLFARQAAYELRSHWRARSLIGLEVALPLSLLVILGYLLQDTPGGPLADRYADVFVPNMTALGVVTTCFAGLGVTVATTRLTGTTKRLRGTPLPGWVSLTALGAQALAVGAAIAALCALSGWGLLGVSPPAAGPFLLATAVGGTAFVTLGVAASTFVRRAEAAPALTNLLLWPLAFVSGAFTDIPSGSLMHRVALALPLRHLLDAMNDATGGRGVEWGGLAVVAGWGAVGAAVAAARWPRRA